MTNGYPMQNFLPHFEQSAALMRITDKEFDQMRLLISQKFGINLSEEKKSLLVGRLQKILRTGGFQSFDQYYDNLLKDRSGKAISGLIDHISTNHTYFNREKAHFDYFRSHVLPEVLRKLRQQKSNDLRIWCAGCSSGEEPYMLLMLMHEVLGDDYRQFDAGLLATDISDRVLHTAKQGIYPLDRIEALSDQQKRKYFSRCDGERVQISEELRREVVFRRFNLMNEKFPFRKQFHIIFCRNVMIYFDRETRDALVKRFHAATEPGGYLFIGHSETLGREQPLYEYLIPAAYRKK